MSYKKIRNLYGRSTREKFETGMSVPSSNLISCNDISLNTQQYAMSRGAIGYDKKSTADPRIMGPPRWFNYHTTAKYYSKSPNTETKRHMKNFITSIPYTLPCDRCKIHASEYITMHEKMGTLDWAVNHRSNLFKFFVDFHNFVNVRLGKPEFSLQEAYKLYDMMSVCWFNQATD